MSNQNQNQPPLSSEPTPVGELLLDFLDNLEANAAHSADALQAEMDAVTKASNEAAVKGEWEEVETLSVVMHGLYRRRLGKENDDPS